MKRLGILATACLVFGCNDQPSWYDESKANQQVKDTRIEQFKIQGMDQVQAQRTADFETYWRNTELAGRDIRPVEGQTLKDVITQPSE